MFRLDGNIKVNVPEEIKPDDNPKSFWKSAKSHLLRCITSLPRMIERKLERVGCPRNNCKSRQVPSWADSRCNIQIQPDCLAINGSLDIN